MAKQYTASDAAVTAFLLKVEAGETGTEALNASAHVIYREIQAGIEDKGVRAARSHGWCGVFNEVMQDIFPLGPLDEHDWRDSDGVSCSGERWRDAEGYDRAGLDHNGRDRDGFDSNSLDRDGYDRAGLDQDGFTRTDPGAYRFNSDGFGRDGFHKDTGNVYTYLTKAILEQWATSDDFRFNRTGWDVDGYNRRGFNAAGFNRRGLDRDGKDVDGFDPLGWKYQRNASTRQGEYIHKSTGETYSAAGFDVYGAHRDTGNGYDPEGYNANGVNRAGDPRPIEDKASVTA